MKNNYTLLAVVSRDGQSMLFCKRRKPPYQGLCNFPGGKIEPGETPIESAYRELEEETGIPQSAVTLAPIMTLSYPLEDTQMEVCAGRLTCDVSLREEVNPLLWISAAESYADPDRFAGVGNLQHIKAYLEKYTTLLK